MVWTAGFHLNANSNSSTLVTLMILSSGVLQEVHSLTIKHGSKPVSSQITFGECQI